MTTKVKIENLTGNRRCLYVQPFDPDDEGLDKLPVAGFSVVKPGESIELYVHQYQDLQITEKNDDAD